MIVLLTRHSNNQPVSLTKQIADSGEGKVWETNIKGYLAKIYHDPTPARIAKLKVMLANPPADPMLNHNHVSIAWVSDLLKDNNGKYLGFLMPAIKNSKQLSSICNPKRRKKVAPGFNWYYLHVTALNAAWIIQSIHAKGYVLGDIKLENILVNPRAMTAVIDTDSFQVRDSQSNQVYRCTVGSEGFTPPELLGKDFDTTNQTEIHDRFRLAVLIHYLLFGEHPFSAGQWTGVGEYPEQTELIKQGYWYGSHNSPIRETVNTIPLGVLHPELKRFFLQCFNDGHTQPHLRPCAKDWHNALETAVNQLTVCSRIDGHHYSKHCGSCYWCERAATLNVDIFSHAFSTIKVFSADDITELIKQKGKQITVVGQVFSTRYLSKNTNKFFINCDKNKTRINGYSHFRVIMFFEGIQNLAKFKNLSIDDLRQWKSQYIKITGILDIERNKILQIVLKESTQIKLINALEANQLLSQTYIPVGFSQIKQPSVPPQVLPQYRKQNLSPRQSTQSANSLKTPNQGASQIKQPSPTSQTSPPKVSSKYRRKTVSSSRHPQKSTSPNRTSKQLASQTKKPSSSSQVPSQYHRLLIKFCLLYSFNLKFGDGRFGFARVVIWVRDSNR